MKKILKIVKKIFKNINDIYRYQKRLVNFERKYWSREYDSDRDARDDEYLYHESVAKKCKIGIVEIGVLYGETSKILSEANPNIPVYGIDPIIPDSMNKNLLGNIDKIKKNTENCRNFTLIRDYSFNVVKKWDKEFDYIFIDGDHNYEAVKKDYEDWFPKLAVGGLIAFHDSTMNRSNIKYWSGPSKLTDDMIKNNKDFIFEKSVGRITVFKKIK